MAAIELLGDATWRRITPLQASELAPASLSIAAGDVVVLLRGVETVDQPDSDCCGGDWELASKSGVVIVEHFCRRSYPWGLHRRRPVVAVLDEVPGDVFVWAYVVY